MQLEDLVYESDSFYEDEQAAMRELPKDASGLERLMEHIRRTDSYFAWMFLFEEFGEILDASAGEPEDTAGD